tara:strand:- start:2675 stop:2830 length:156 start_codon:yes stop_codon:yes gene_type:complete
MGIVKDITLPDCRALNRMALPLFSGPKDPDRVLGPKDPVVIIGNENNRDEF